MKNQLLKFYAILLILVIGVYSNTFNHSFVLDDDVVFRQNIYVQQGITAIPDILSNGFLVGYNNKNDQSYRPLVLIDFAIEKSLFGNNPHAHHRMNVLFYGLLCCVLFSFLNLLFKKEKPWVAFWISLLFALHPIHTEVVANIKSRDEILHTLFILLSLINMLEYIDSQKNRRLIWSLLCFFLALLSKEMAVTYIALLPLTIWFFRTIEIKKLTIVTSYFAGVLVLYFLIRSAILDTITFDERMSIINNGLAAAETYPEQLATTIYIFANYIKLLFFPHPLTWDYSYPHFQIVDFSNVVVILTIVVFIVIGVWSLLKLKSKNIFAFCFLFFIISFSIVSNFFILIGATLGERFLFFPSIAFCVALVLGISLLFERMQIKGKNLIPLTILLIGLIYSFKTIDRNKEWETNYTLFEAGVIATPNNSRAISAVGSMNRELAEQSKNQQEQIIYYKKAIKAYRKSVELLETNADSYYNLGVIYMNTNQNELAKASFKKAIEVQPDNIKSLNNLGVIYFREQNLNEALIIFEQTLKLNPNFQSAYANLGAVYHNLGDLVKAKQYYSKALELNTNDQNTRTNFNKLK